MGGRTGLGDGSQVAHRRQRGGTARGMLLAASLVVALPAMVAVGADGASPSPGPGSAGPFESDWVYTLAIPAGWSVFLSEAGPEGGEDLFDGPEDQSARVGGGLADPGSTVEQRVEANRAEVLLEPGCQSDPTLDRPTTLDGVPGIAWSWACPERFHAAINTIHLGMRLRLEVSVSSEQEAQAHVLLEELRQGFAWKEPEATPDLSAIDAELQGRYENTWHPLELETATLAAAGLGAQAEESGWPEYAAALGTTRSAVKFENGALVLYQAYDGGAWEMGWTGRYELLDGQTIRATDLEFRDPIVYEFQLRDGILTMDVISSAYPDPADFVWQTAIYETLPLTRVP